MAQGKAETKNSPKAEKAARKNRNQDQGTSQSKSATISFTKCLKNGFVVDNQQYRFECSNDEPQSYKFKNTTKGGEVISEDKKKHPQKAISFLHEISTEINEKLGDKKTKEQYLILWGEEEYEHNTDAPFLEFSGRSDGNFTLETFNLIGFIQKDKQTIKIGSRFGNKFLKYIIADADGCLELEDLGGNETTQDDYSWLLALLWKTKAKRAFRLGVPKMYLSKQEHLARVKGMIDPVDYSINRKTGKYLCTYREHSYENPAVTLFVKAYKYLSRQSGRQILQSIRNIYNTFQTANAGRQRTNAELLATKHFTNPYYHDYNILIELSKKVLNRYSTVIGDKESSSGLLFDVSMLFEYFIRKLLVRNGILVRDKNTKIKKIPHHGTYKEGARSLYPDLVIEANAKVAVFDVKYKNFDNYYGVKREDLFQLHTYVGQWSNDNNISACGFIYPISEAKFERISSETVPFRKGKITVAGHDIPFYVFFLVIPNSESDNPNSESDNPNSESDNFSQKMKTNCDDFVKHFCEEVLR